MADWTFTTSDALTAQTWAKKWWIEAKTESYFYSHGFVGRGNDNIIVEFPELEENQGYKHTYGQVRELSGAGVSGDSTMEGNEEAPSVYDDAIEINQVRNAVRSAGKLSEQYPSDRAVRGWAEELLRRWMAAKLDQDIFDALGLSLTKAIYGGDATATTDIEAGDYMTTSLISKCVAYAKKATPNEAATHSSSTSKTPLSCRYPASACHPAPAGNDSGGRTRLKALASLTESLCVISTE